ncbi:agamous-like MADS-box protein AGL29 [Vigna unguiculata]|uniref:MADS-box transcription factor n=1 Tax=Vigna unguiculata TaxID=3917 RepID=A0A4D6L9M6_VIGUN|nr:agamous-like MADS-box protein AGL29 [Vigna unguiculata]QCD85243.1 MADS-box transcription factor [Vigna unguiculata]
MGRRKIDIAEVKDPNDRQVTFSKRRTGLFKKANDLSVKCGAELAIVMFSPAKRPYSFGHPSVNVVADKFLRKNPTSNYVRENDAPDDEVDDIERLRQQLSVVEVHINEEQKKATELDEREKEQETSEAQNKELQNSPVLRRMVEDYVDAIEVSECMLLLAKEPVIGISNRPICKRRRRN